MMATRHRRGVLASRRRIDPDDIAGLKLWLKADSEAYADNDAVGTATDRSGIGNNFTQATAGKKPIFKTNIVNGRPVYRFDGADDNLDGPNLMSGATAGEVFIVVKADVDPPAAEAQTGFWQFGDDAGFAAHVPYTNGNLYDNWGSNARKDNVASPSLSSAFRLYNVSSASGSWVSRLDGSQLYSTGTNTVAWSTAPKIGRSVYAAALLYLDGDVAECIIYNSVLSAGNRDSIEGYLGGKYGLAIA